MVENKKTVRVDNQRTTLKIVMTAMFVALAFVFEIVTKFIPFLQMPQGGAISITMLPLIIGALLLGPVYGTIGGVAFGFLNFCFDGFVIHWGSIFLDYLVAFGLIGVAGFFRPFFYKNKIWSLGVAIVVACVLRYISSSLSGVLFFGDYAPEGMNPWFYSFIVYNAAYMGPSLVANLVVGYAIYVPMQKLTKTPQMANIYKVKSKEIAE